MTTCFTTIATAQIPDLDGQLWPIELAAALSICQQLFVGGIETTTKLLTEALLLLTRHPDQYQRLRADPSRIPAVIEEVLRLATPAQGLYRLVTRDVDLEGVHIPAGSRGRRRLRRRQPRPRPVRPTPTTSTPTAPASTPTSPSAAASTSASAPALARLEARVALEVLTRRIERWTLADDTTLEYEPSFILRGLKSLRLHFDCAVREPAR